LHSLPYLVVVAQVEKLVVQITKVSFINNLAMNWIELKSEEELNTVKEKSKERPQVIFKHSTRCSISTMAKSRLERGETPNGIDFIYLDLIANRNISALIADDFKVQHESPQILIIKNGVCIYDESHNGINMEEIEEVINQ
jgi:bacillithiol system protein YtxJ